MVIVINNSSSSSVHVDLNKIQRFTGNNLSLDFPENINTIILTGNNCSLKIAKNYGKVKVIGNNCIIDLSYCDGTVEYIGNNGRIIMDCNVKPGAVTYHGINGSIITQDNLIKWFNNNDSSGPMKFYATKSNVVYKKLSLSKPVTVTIHSNNFNIM